ncbi:MmgE/PrpD family protein [uncultured Arthrobacter sp.]|uniref:MmgE/PrpD family protein n=1 Tax=uncultured Arthrobacter sp. TaxID=114050 RepID=UPI0026102856|nr:MmgE/PrpD family protein [uncultured Arthrobacter sp.]
MTPPVKAVTTTVTQRLAELVSLSSEDVRQTALEAAVAAVIDTVACGLRGSGLPVSQAVRAAVNLQGMPGRFMCFDGSKTQSAPQAAYINATAAHSLELDDTDAIGLTHPGVVIIPAALAATQELPVTGRQFLEAVIVGYDVAVRLSRWVNPEHRMRGFHTTATVTSLGAVAAVARLRGMSIDQCASAMGIALSYAGGTFEFVQAGSNLKRVHAGKASSTAVQSCDLAACGVEGPLTALEGSHGFYATSVGPNMPELDLSDLGRNFLIEAVGTKRHACCRFCHTAIDAAIELFRQNVRVFPHSLIEVAVSSLCHEQTGGQNPKNELQRQFSTPYGVALGLLYGRTSLSDFQDRPDEAALVLARRVRMVTDLSLEPRNRRATVRIITGASVVEEQLDEPRGEPTSPFTAEERFEKYLSLTSKLAPTAAGYLYEGLCGLSGTPRMAPVIDLIAAATSE